MHEETIKLSPEETNNKGKYFKSVFDKFDTDKSGHIELNELVEMLKSDDDVPRRISKNIFKAADKDGNGLLNYNEFQAMVQDEDYSEVFSKYVNLYIRYVLPRNKAAHLIQTDGSIPDGVYEEKYKCWPPPVALILITILEITFFVLDEVSRDTSSYADGRMSNIFIYHPYKRQEAWRFFTYMFVHIGYMHLVVNLVVQLCLGVPLEMVHRWRVLVVYFSGVIAGSLCTSIVDPTTFLAGASGGVYALMTAHIGTICMNWREMEVPIFQLLIFIIIISMDVGTSIYNRYFLNLEENIGYAAHFGGAIAGLLVGIWNLKNFVPTKRETFLWWYAIIFYIKFMGIMIILNIIWTNHFLSPKAT